MELCDGDVDSLLQKEKYFGTKLLRRLAKHLASAFKTLDEHSIIHRDVKPANILLKYNYTLPNQSPTTEATTDTKPP